MRSLEMWKTESRTQTNRTRPTSSGRLHRRTGLGSLIVFGFFLVLLTPLRAAVVNVIINPETNPVQTTSGNIVPDGTALFVVSYKTTQDAFFTALRGAASSADLATVFSTQLKFFNSTPFLKGDYGTYENPEIGWSSEGGAIAEISPTTTSNLPIFTLFSSSANLFDANANFLLVKSRGTNVDSYIPKDDSPSTIEIGPDSLSGSDVIFGQFFSSTQAFQMAAAGAYGLITSATTKTMNAGSTSTYQILTNNGANTYALSSNPSSLGASIDATTGLITLSPGASIDGSFSLTFTASNSLTGNTATGSLTVTVQAASGPTFTSSATATATAGVPFSYPITTDVASTFTAISSLPSGLTLNPATGVLSGIPRSADTFPITIRAARTINAASFTDEILTLTVSSPTLAIADLVSGQLTRTAGTAYTVPVTIPAGFTADSNTIETTIIGVTYSAGYIQISSTTAPFDKGKTSEPVSLILSRTSGLDGSKVSASINFNLRLVAPAPTALTTAGPFEVNVGEDYSLQLLTDVSTICPKQKISIPEALPLGLINNNGLITGKNTSTTLPYEFDVNVIAENSTSYEGGGTRTFPVKFRLQNPAAPVITSSLLTRLAGVGKAFTQYSAGASGAPFRYTASNLPPGLFLDGQTIKGTPTSAGNYTVRLQAENYFRPGLPSSGLQIGSASFQIYVSNAKPSKTTSIFGTNDLRVGTSATLSGGEGVRINGYGLPPGLIFDKATGLITGTPTVAGTFTATIFIQNSLGWIDKTVTLRVKSRLEL